MECRREDDEHQPLLTVDHTTLVPA
jgi:hypothetical protein